MRRRIPPVVAKTHTPGPWHSHYSTAVAEQADGEYVTATAITDVESGVYELSGIRGNLIAFVPHDERHEANARLISSAPMLLQTMAGVLKQMKDGGYFKDSVIGRWAFILESAINRAEGRGE
jgi:hypothetical protein